MSSDRVGLINLNNNKFSRTKAIKSPGRQKKLVIKQSPLYNNSPKDKILTRTQTNRASRLNIVNEEQTESTDGNKNPL